MTTVLTFMRFREVAKLTSSAHSNNRLAQIRAQRTRRRLYLMVLSILLPFLPIVITLAVLNIRGSLPLRPFNYSEIHDHVVPYKWNTILLLPSESFDFAYTNMAYIPILAAIPVFMFFGMTKDAMNTYRRGFLSAGLGNIFPSLHQEYDPVRAAYASAYGSRVTTSSAYVSIIFPDFNQVKITVADQLLERKSRLYSLDKSLLLARRLALDLVTTQINLSIPPLQMLKKEGM